MAATLPSTYVLADAFLRTPQGQSDVPFIVYFICGNPGVLSYYHQFLSLLSDSLSKAPEQAERSQLPPEGRDSRCVIAGFSLGGFDVDSQQSRRETSDSLISSLQHPPGTAKGPLYSLEDQIELTHQRVDAVARHVDGHSGNPAKVILVGHSVGAYIALEVIRRLYASSEGTMERQSSFELAGAILLTPTIVDIAKSDSGRILTPLVTYVPALPSLLQWATRGLVGVLPEWALRWTVGQVTGMREDPLQTTLAWLKSENGVKQTLAMALEEMRDIKEDRWGEEIWGAAQDIAREGGGARGEEWQAPLLVLYFAQKDHWVSNTTRDEILRLRRRNNSDYDMTESKSWPRVEVENEGRKVVHGWCINGSAFMAEQVIKWVKEMQAISRR